MRITNDDNKPSLEDAIAHYGVKGMKWGVRKKSSTRGPTSKEIKRARQVVISKRNKEFVNAKGVRAKTSIAMLGEASKHLTDDYRATPERTIAFRMTQGEKAATALLSLPTFGGAVAYSVLQNGLQNHVIKDQAAAAKRVNTKK